MGIFNFLFKKDKEPPKQEPAPTNYENNVSISVAFDNSISPKAKASTQQGNYSTTLKIEYVKIPTSGDENACPMCAQFEGKIFPSTDAPKLPLCPSCSCAYEHYLQDDLPPDAVISSKSDFVLPAECTMLFYKNQQKIREETDINKLIRLCENQLKKLHEFMAPYISAAFEAPVELACRDLLPDLYMRIGKWEKAEKTIKICISEKAFTAEEGSTALAYFESYRRVATETLNYISQNPGCLQRNIYKKMGYEGEEKETLKDFISHSKLIKKVKSNNTNQLFCNTKEI